jgi:hypothetical protein
MQSTGGHHPVQWFHLFPRKKADNGWWNYEGKNGDRSSTAKILLHTADKDKKVVEGFLINNLLCWAKMQTIISLSLKFDKIEVDKNEKGLFKKSFEDVKVVGVLEMVL